MRAVAEAAIDAGAVLLGTVVVAELTSPQRSMHWSFYVLVGAACLGAVVAVAGVILANYPLISASALLLSSNILSAFFIKRFSLYKDMDKKIERIQEEAGRVDAQTRLLLDTKKQLEVDLNGLRLLEQRVQDEFAKHTDLERQTRSELDRLQRESNQTGAEVDLQAQTGQTLIEKFTQLITQLRDQKAAVEAQMGTLKTGVAKVEALDGDFCQERQAFQLELKQRNEQIQQLQAKLTELQTKEAAEVREELTEASRLDEAAHRAAEAMDQAEHNRLQIVTKAAADMGKLAGEVQQAQALFKELDAWACQLLNPPKIFPETPSPALPKPDLKLVSGPISKVPCHLPGSPSALPAGSSFPDMSTTTKKSTQGIF